MIVKHLFFSLMERLNGIEQGWSNGTESPDKLREQILELRKVSDDILDHWLVFEERMAKFQQLVTYGNAPKDLTYDNESIDTESIFEEMDQVPDDVAEKIFNEIKKMSNEQPSSSQVVSMLSGEAVHYFRRGQGYYSLLMYKEAVNHFDQVLEREPDLDIARMFLAYSQMMAGDLHEAGRHFHLISHTTNHQLLKATALNAEGCIMAALGREDQALSLFEKSMDSYPKLKDPLFNRALILTKMQLYGEAKKSWLEYCETDSEDWEAILALAKCYQAEGDFATAEATLHGLLVTGQDQDILLEAGKMFEDLRQFGNASLCYQLMLNNDPLSAVAWHGLGWNMWHAEGLPGGLNYIKKAISLSPKHPDFQFSYGWILYQMNQLDAAERVFNHILHQEGRYPLAVAGLIHVFIAREQWPKAARYCRLLTEDDHEATRALGYFQSGRLWLVQGDYSQAEANLKKSVEISPEMKDSYLLLGLVWHITGNRERALEAWEHTL
jgi:tetratricopeptide (TPR) repeat protein